MELSLQLATLHFTPERKFECEITLRQLSDELLTPPAQSGGCGSAASGDPVLVRRLHACKGRLQTLLGQHAVAAQCFVQAAEAAGQVSKQDVRCDWFV